VNWLTIGARFFEWRTRRFTPTGLAVYKAGGNESYAACSRCTCVSSHMDQPNKARKARQVTYDPRNVVVTHPAYLDIEVSYRIGDT
jgi:hypothetical protein